MNKVLKYLIHIIALIFFAFSASPSFSKDFSANTFYPLEIGNEWIYKHTYYDEAGKKPASSKILIANRIDKQNGNIEFTGEDNAVLFHKTSEGIMYSGFLILKNSLSLGSHWKSGTYNYNQRQDRVEAIDISVNIGAKEYENCIRTLSKYDAHATPRGDQTIYLAYESKTTYCSQIGPVLIEIIEVSESGKRKPLSRSELISFKKRQSIKRQKPETPVFMAIGVSDSFRFPEKDLLHPSLSPDDKWLVYRKLSRFSGSKIFHSLDSTYKKLYYSEIGRNEKIELPLPKKKLRNVGLITAWSQNGKVLALNAEIDEKDCIVLFDFSGSKPRLIEYFESENKPFYWTSENALLYIATSGNIMKKYPNKKPERVVYIGKYIYDFQLASNETLLYSLSNNPWKIYKTSIKNSEHQTLVFEDDWTPVFILSPDGQFALISTRDHEKANSWNTTLYNLKTNMSIMKISAEVRHARFSPDGTKLAYKEMATQSNYPKTIFSNPHFFILDLMTKQIRDYGYGVSENFNWTPDGNHIIYSMKRVHESLAVYKNGIYIMQISDGEEVAKLTSVNTLEPVMSHSGKFVVWEGANMDTFFVVQNPLNVNLFQAVK